MSALRALREEILVDGEDLKLSGDDLARIKASLPAGPLSPDDLQALLEMRAQARAVSPDFDRFFFPLLKSALLADGSVSAAEQFQLLRLLYGGGGVDDAERQFLQELASEIKDASPEFDALRRQALSD